MRIEFENDRKNVMKGPMVNYRLFSKTHVGSLITDNLGLDEPGQEDKDAESQWNTNIQMTSDQDGLKAIISRWSKRFSADAARPQFAG